MKTTVLRELKKGMPQLQLEECVTFQNVIYTDPIRKGQCRTKEGNILKMFKTEDGKSSFFYILTFFSIGIQLPNVPDACSLRKKYNRPTKKIQKCDNIKFRHAMDKFQKQSNYCSCCCNLFTPVKRSQLLQPFDMEGNWITPTEFKFMYTADRMYTNQSSPLVFPKKCLGCGRYALNKKKRKKNFHLDTEHPTVEISFEHVSLCGKQYCLDYIYGIEKVLKNNFL